MTLQRNERGTFDAYAWPGGYPILYLFADGEVCCAGCASGENGSEASESASDPGWRLVGADIHWEGEPERCAHCGAQIESAYGEPEPTE